MAVVALFFKMVSLCSLFGTHFRNPMPHTSAPHALRMNFLFLDRADRVAAWHFRSDARMPCPDSRFSLPVAMVTTRDVEGESRLSMLIASFEKELVTATSVPV